MHLITRKHTYINIVKNVEVSLLKLFEILPKFLKNQNILG